MPVSKKKATAKKAPKPSSASFPALSAPATRALAGKGITNLKQLSKLSEADILKLHGMGKNSIPKFQEALKANGLSFKKNDPQAKQIKQSNPGAVNDYMKKLQHPMKNIAQAVRQLILAADKKIGEEIAWNAPSFFYTGPMKPFNPKEYKRFIVGFNFFRKDCLRLIFLTGSKLNDTTGLLEGDYADGRRLVLLYTMDDVKTKGQVLQKLVKRWLQLQDK